MRTPTVVRLIAIALTLLVLVACAGGPMPTTTVAPARATEAPPAPAEHPPTATPATAPPTAPPTPDPTLTEPLPTPTSALTDEERINMGREVFAVRCQACHQSDGRGVPGAFPPLAGSPLATAEDVSAPIQRVLLGRNAMPSFQSVLSDHEIATVLSYVRNAFGNDASVVAIEKVKQVRSDLASQ